ncbi:extracellular solute-binding protein [Lysinibacter sp. HNR]|uniref:extracellular solute-binding protein n=1 Tax=Lysinibacter sp. HNR TaxID=3031408 RepID=UPI0024348923|nr:extracellular solute-binding protein [Lysinibacter sp. HNR]WGD38033.1 extracellular solute-binding protein [Lysinibacter sp. HNR]
MKKTVRTSTLACAVISTLALSACGFGGGTSGDSGGANTINLLVPTYSDGTKGLWEDVISGFEVENPDINVSLEVQSWDNINDVIKTKVQANAAPDILNIDAFAGFAADDLLYPASDVVSPTVLDDFQPSLAQNASIDGVQYGLPLIASARAMFYNKQLMEQAGVTDIPQTWTELLSASQKVQALGNGTYGYGMPLGSEEAQAETGIWFYGGGGGYGDAAQLTIDDPLNVAAAEEMKTFIEGNATQPDAGSSNRTPLMNVFIQGKIGFIVGLPPTVGQIDEKNPELDYGIAPLATKDGVSMTLGVADHLMAFKNDGQKQEAIKKFLDYYYSADVYVPWVEAEGFLPTTLSGSDALAGNETLKPFLEVLPDAQFYPSTNSDWSTAQGAIQSLMGQVAQGKAPAEVLSQIQSQVGGR